MTGPTLKVSEFADGANLIGDDQGAKFRSDPEFQRSCQEVLTTLTVGRVM